MTIAAAAPPTPPESIGGPMTIARLRAWVREAQRGARLIYARGAACRQDCGQGVADEVARLGSGAVDKASGRTGVGLKLISEHHAKIAGESCYLIVRTQRPVRPGELP